MRGYCGLSHTRPEDQKSRSHELELSKVLHYLFMSSLVSHFNACYKKKLTTVVMAILFSDTPRRFNQVF